MRLSVRAAVGSVVVVSSVITLDVGGSVVVDASLVGVSAVLEKVVDGVVNSTCTFSRLVCSSFRTSTLGSTREGSTTTVVGSSGVEVDDVHGRDTLMILFGMVGSASVISARNHVVEKNHKTAAAYKKKRANKTEISIKSAGTTFR